MESEKEQVYFILETLEVAFIGFFSLVSKNGKIGVKVLLFEVSVCTYSIILWTSLTRDSDDEEDRWSFKRSIKALTTCAIVQNIYQIIFLIVQKTNLTFNLLENVRF